MKCKQDLLTCESCQRVHKGRCPLCAKHQARLGLEINRAVRLARNLPDVLKQNSEYRRILDILLEAQCLADRLHIRKPKRFFGSW